MTLYFCLNFAGTNFRHWPSVVVSLGRLICAILRFSFANCRSVISQNSFRKLQIFTVRKPTDFRRKLQFHFATTYELNSLNYFIFLLFCFVGDVPFRFSRRIKVHKTNSQNFCKNKYAGKMYWRASLLYYHSQTSNLRLREGEKGKE